MTMAEITEAWASQRRIGIRDLRGPGRVQKIAHSRQDLWLHIRQHTGLSNRAIAQHFNNRSHTTIIRGVNAAKKRAAKQ